MGNLNAPINGLSKCVRWRCNVNKKLFSLRNYDKIPLKKFHSYS